jgi:hypothetical protein
MKKEVLEDILYKQFYHMVNEETEEEDMAGCREMAIAAIKLLDDLGVLKPNLSSIVSSLNESGTEVYFGPIDAGSVSTTHTYNELPKHKQLDLTQVVEGE